MDHPVPDSDCLSGEMDSVPLPSGNQGHDHRSSGTEQRLLHACPGAADFSAVSVLRRISCLRWTLCYHADGVCHRQSLPDTLSDRETAADPVQSDSFRTVSEAGLAGSGTDQCYSLVLFLLAEKAVDFLLFRVYNTRIITGRTESCCSAKK